MRFLTLGPDRRYRRKRRGSLPEPQPERGEPGLVLGLQEQQAAKIPQEFRVDPGDIEPFRKRARRLVECPPGDEPTLQGIISRLVADADLEPRWGFGFEDGDSGADRRGFFHDQGELGSQVDRFHPDFDPRLGVPIGQQSIDRGRTSLDLDPTPPNGP